MERAIVAQYPADAPPFAVVRGCFEKERVFEVIDRLAAPGGLHEAIGDWLETMFNYTVEGRASSVSLNLASGGYVVVTVSQYPPGLREALETILGDDIEVMRFLDLDDDAMPPWREYQAVADLPLADEVESGFPPLPPLGGGDDEPTIVPGAGVVLGDPLCGLPLGWSVATGGSAARHGYLPPDAGWEKTFEGFEQAETLLAGWSDPRVVGFFEDDTKQRFYLLVDPAMSGDEMQAVADEISGQYPSDGPPYTVMKGCFAKDRIATVRERLDVIKRTLDGWLADLEGLSEGERASFLGISAAAGGYVVLETSHYPPGLREALAEVIGGDAELVRVLTAVSGPFAEWSDYLEVAELPRYAEAVQSGYPPFPPLVGDGPAATDATTTTVAAAPATTAATNGKSAATLALAAGGLVAAAALAGIALRARRRSARR